MPDAELIDKLHKSPDTGMKLLMDEYMGLVCSVVRGKLSGVCTNEDIEDCVSDAFIAFYHQLDRFDFSRGTVKAYLCSIARNKAVSVYLCKIKEGGTVPLDDELQLTADSFSVEEEYLTSETRQEIMRAIVALGEPDHEIIVRRFFLGEPSKAIAERLNMTVSAVNVRVHRALAKLREN